LTLDLKNFSLSNFKEIENFRLGLGSTMFLGLVVLLSLLYNLFLAVGVDKTFAAIQFPLVLIFTTSFAFLLLYSVFGGLARERFKKGFFFFESGKPQFSNVLVSMGIAVLMAVLFSVGFSLAPVQQFSVQTTFSFTNLLNDVGTIGLTFINYAVVPAINEELAWAGLFLVVYISCYLLFVRRNPNSQRHAAALFIAFAVTLVSFGVMHYNSYSIVLQGNYAQYSANPSAWSNLHPGKPIPNDPNSFGGIIQLLLSLSVAGLFRFVNTAFIIVTRDFYQGVKNHAYINAGLLFLDAALPSYGAWAYLVLVVLFFLLLDVIENAFSKSTDD
jgi:hypothetical protein